MNAMRKLFVVMGSPVYWHNICASVRTLMERFYGYVPENTFKGKRLFFLYQGAAPTQMMIDDGEYTMSRFAGMYGFIYEGMYEQVKGFGNTPHYGCTVACSGRTCRPAWAFTMKS